MSKKSETILIWLAALVAAILLSNPSHAFKAGPYLEQSLVWTCGSTCQVGPYLQDSLSHHINEEHV